MTDYTTPSAAPQNLDQLKAMTDAQALDLTAQLTAAGQLPPPPSLTTLTAAQHARNLDQLGAALGGHALAWGQVAPSGSSAAHYSNGLLYAAVMLRSIHVLNPHPLNALTVFTTWAASFTRDVLDETGQGGSADSVLEDGPQLILPSITGERDRGALMAAHSAFMLGTWGVVMEMTDSEVNQLLALAGAVIAPHLDPPSPGPGMRA